MVQRIFIKLQIWQKGIKWYKDKKDENVQKMDTELKLGQKQRYAKSINGI
jgi:DNA uptake protein ComE-like DNA-binding protein